MQAGEALAPALVGTGARHSGFGLCPSSQGPPHPWRSQAASGMTWPWGSVTSTLPGESELLSDLPGWNRGMPTHLSQPAEGLQSWSSLSHIRQARGW